MVPSMGLEGKYTDHINSSCSLWKGGQSWDCHVQMRWPRCMIAGSTIDAIIMVYIVILLATWSGSTLVLQAIYCRKEDPVSHQNSESSESKEPVQRTVDMLTH